MFFEANELNKNTSNFKNYMYKPFLMTLELTEN